MLNQHALDRLKVAQFRPDAIATIFEHMAKCVEQFGVGASQFRLGYQKPGDYVEAGDLVPVIILALEPADVRATLDDDQRATQE